MVAVTAMIMTGEMGVMGETVVGGGEGEGDEVAITGGGMTGRHTGTGIGTIVGRYLLDDMGDVDEADRGALHREGPGMEVPRGGITEPEVLLVVTHADPRLPQGQQRWGRWNRKRMSLGETLDPARLTPSQLQSNLHLQFYQISRVRKLPRQLKVPPQVINWQPRPPPQTALTQRPQCRLPPMNPGRGTRGRPKGWTASILPPSILRPLRRGRR